MGLNEQHIVPPGIKDEKRVSTNERGLQGHGDAYDIECQEQAGDDDTLDSLSRVISNNARPECFKNTFQEMTCAIICAFATMLGTITMGGMIVALPEIGRDYNVSGGALTWSVSSSALATGSFLLLTGQLADMFGRKWSVIISYLFFAVSALIAGLVHNYIIFLVFRAIGGIPAASSVTAAVGILGAAYKPGKRKNAALATFGAGSPVGFVVGLVAGGICTEIASWRTTLFVFAVIYLIAGIVGIFVLPKDKITPAKEERWRLLKKVDWIGAFLTVAGFTLFVFALSDWDTSPHGWKTSYIIATLVIGVVLIVLFFVHETYWASNPMMPMHIWKAPGFLLSIMIIFCAWGVFTGDLIFYATLYFQNIKDASAILTTAYFIPQVVAGVAVNAAMAFLLHRVPGRFILIVAFVCYIAAGVLWSQADVDTLYWAMPFPALILIVIGADAAYNVCNLHALSTVDHTLQSTAGGVFNTFLQLSTAVGLAVASSVVAATQEDQENATKPQLVRAYRSAFYFAIGVSGVGLILSIFLKLGTVGHKEKDDEEPAEPVGASSN